MKRWAKYLFVFMALFLVACGSSGGKGSSSGGKTLTVGLSGDAISLDPVMTNDNQSSNVMTQIYEGLVKLDKDGKIVPALAESYEQVDDVTYRFKLKKGVKFHNGEEMKASDVVFSLKRAIVAPNVTHLFQTIDENTVKALDDYSVEFKQKEPFAGIMSALCHPGGFIVNEKAVKKAGDDYSQHPVGTNALKFVKWSRSNSIELEKFKDYHGEKLGFDKLVLRVIPEPSNRVIELESGGVDMAYDIIATDLKKVEENPDLNLIKSLDYGETYMGFNCAKKPLNDPKVREAISLALDTDSIVKAVFHDLGKTAKGVLPPTLPYSIADKQSLQKRDVEKAKALLKEAGVEKGFKLSIATNENKDRSDMATAMKEQLAEVGIDASINVLEWSAFNDLLKKGGQDLFMIAWTADSSDPDTFLFPCFHSSARGEGGNYIFLEDKKVDELLEKGRYAQEDSERAKSYEEVQKYLMDIHAWVPLHNKELTCATRKNIKGMWLSPLGFYQITQVKIEDK
ncbi:ABC transporter substrate-binding protein [Atopobacter sp. AH10]|uniref:ABC transporter substrate-binding protein n=1 Tax=Atopobacter sp. AH10 TaxID=2315861 RepID=UPI000EF22510|nr:ABC transporter substrate-binding protein [Atopobacter sp. AH10]RLK64173.1 ABC transporter substrate-binding protein [Atopobacter sp. AH10]